MKKTITTLLLAIPLIITTLHSQNAPDFTVTTIDNQTLHLYEKLDAGYTVVLDIFFADCVPCQTWTPEVEALHQDYLNSPNVLVWGISDRDTDAYLQAFKTSLNVTYPTAGAEGGGDVMASLYDNTFNLVGFPTYAVVCPNRSIYWDIWPISAGLQQIRDKIVACGGITNTNPVKPFLSEMKITPNPVATNATLRFGLEQPNTVQLQIWNVLGQVVQTQEWTLMAGEQNLELNVEALPQGSYFARLQAGEQTQTLPFLKR